MKKLSQIKFYTPHFHDRLSEMFLKDTIIIRTRFLAFEGLPSQTFLLQCSIFQILRYKPYDVCNQGHLVTEKRFQLQHILFCSAWTTLFPFKHAVNGQNILTLQSLSFSKKQTNNVFLYVSKLIVIFIKYILLYNLFSSPKIPLASKIALM